MAELGRPPSLASQRTELLCELQALTTEGIKNELERLRIMRQLTALTEPGEMKVQVS
jgi:hypothetical protein